MDFIHPRWLFEIPEPSTVSLSPFFQDHSPRSCSTNSWKLSYGFKTATRSVSGRETLVGEGVNHVL